VGRGETSIAGLLFWAMCGGNGLPAANAETKVAMSEITIPEELGQKTRERATNDLEHLARQHAPTPPITQHPNN